MKICDSVPNEMELPVLATSTYLRAVKGQYRYGYLVEGNMVLPFTIRKKYCFQWMQLDSGIYGSASPEETQQFLDNVVAFSKRNLRISHIKSSNTALFEAHPSSSDYCKFGTYLVNLTLSEEELFKNLHSKHRNVIRKASSDGIIIEHGPDKAIEAVALMDETFKRQNKISGFSQSMIERFNHMGDKVDYWIAKDADGVLQGSAIFFWNKENTCYYMHGGSASHTKPGAMNLLMWEAMKCMKSRGVKVFDFVGARLTTERGSKLEGIQRFKSRFGAELKVGYMFRVIVSKPYYYLYIVTMNLAFLLLTHKLPTDVIKEERKKGNF